MKILHIVRQFYPMIGGLENYVFHLASSQRSKGHEVTVLTLNRNFMTNEYLPESEVLPSGISVIRVPFFLSKKYPIALKSFKYLKAHDLINVHAVDFFSDFISLTSLFHRKKCILVTHGGFFHTSWGSVLKRIFFNTITRFSVRNYDKIIACSVNDIQVFNKITKNIQLIDNGVNIYPYLKRPKNPVKDQILYVGRIDTHKRVDLLIELIAKIKERGKLIHLNIVGPDWKGLQKDLEFLAQSKEISDLVHFKGSVSDEELIGLYSESAVFVSASEYEGFGLSAVEAMSSGTLCVLNRISSFEKLLENKSFGRIVDFHNIDQTSKEVLSFLDITEEKYTEFSDAAREYSKNFGWEGVSAQFEEVYKSIQ